MTYHLRDYAAMVTDAVRGPAYLAAVRETVTPGCVVADVGAGPGVLGIYAAMLGARRVYLIEPDDSVGAAMALARDNGVADRVEIIARPSTEVQLDERADVIVSDLRGVLPLFGLHLPAARDMRQRLLAPGGRCIPVRDALHVALIEDADSHEQFTGSWLPLAATMRVEALTAMMANDWHRVHARPAQLLSSPEQWAVLDYASLASSNVDGAVDTVAARDGTAHGMLCWFDSELTARTGFSNSPAAERSLYGQAFFPFAEPVPLAAGDPVHLRLRAVLADHDYEWVWSARLSSPGRGSHEIRQSTLHGRALLPHRLRRRALDFTPLRSVDGDALALLANAIDGERDLAGLATLLADEMPQRFASVSEAIRFVAQHEGMFE